MGITITPGYDFGATEVPTNAKFLLQATGLAVRGIPLSSIPIELTPVFLGVNATDMSTPSDYQVGSLWTDLRGNLWGMDVFGVIKVRGCDGAVESMRFPITNGLYNIDKGAGFGTVSLPVGTSGSSAICFSYPAAGNLPTFGIHLHSLPSLAGTTPTFMRVQLRGSCEVPCNNITTTYHRYRTIGIFVVNSSQAVGHTISYISAVGGQMNGEGIAFANDWEREVWGTDQSTGSCARIWLHGLSVDGGGA